MVISLRQKHNNITIPSIYTGSITKANYSTLNKSSLTPLFTLISVIFKSKGIGAAPTNFRPKGNKIPSTS